MYKRQVYTSELEYPTSHYRNYMEVLERTNTPQIILAEGDSFQFGEHVLVEVLHPPKDIEYYQGYPEGSTQFINNRSLVLKLTYQDSTFQMCIRDRGCYRSGRCPRRADGLPGPGPARGRQP